MTGVLLCTCGSFLAGCASLPSGPARITADEILAGSVLGLTEDRSALIDSHEVLALSEQMRAYVDEHVSAGAEKTVRLQQLTRAVVDNDRFRLDYDETTRTAAATFQERRGNCLSFSSMFVAMARHAGLDAHFQEVDTPPDWSLRDDTLVLNLHVNVLVDKGRSQRKEKRTGSLVRRSVGRDVRIVDFNIADFRTSYDRRLIPDERLLAHFYNNVAVERMQEGDAAAALGYFRQAIENDPTFSPAWTNLGILYMRNGHPAYAEAAHLRALNEDPSDLVAMSNLASLFDQQGLRARAAAYRARVVDHRNRNPYYRFHLAREAFRTEDYDAAIGHLEEAIRMKENDDRFYFLLSASSLEIDDLEAAQRWLARAEAVAATDALKRRYASKMAVLTGAQGRETPR
jgi:tetratricopeptide (TPR) repeat protein